MNFPRRETSGEGEMKEKLVSIWYQGRRSSWECPLSPCFQIHNDPYPTCDTAVVRVRSQNNRLAVWAKFLVSQVLCLEFHQWYYYTVCACTVDVEFVQLHTQRHHIIAKWPNPLVPSFLPSQNWEDLAANNPSWIEMWFFATSTAVE